MNTTGEGGTLTIGDQNPVPMTFSDQKAEQRLRSRLKASPGNRLAVRITPSERPDVEGHALEAALDSAWVNLEVDGDDTEGHAIRINFPSAADADRFRRNVLTAGILAGSIVIASAGAIAITSNVPRDGGGYILDSEVNQQQVQSLSVPTGIDPATDRPYGKGFLERSDGEMNGPADKAAPVLQRPEGRGPLETTE
jgi:hypothetical protein